ncbi:hypothetical protein [Nostoc sp. DedQUE09]|uniref:hypothetical protein n=1 Tax=Nostoc sp. DedQUE09 TaxID=3075394 RepID=UPI002AD3E08B|nr:hypothetical protein [Nostoc sp. DedQUE09]MDZ7955384.1 hypothetical protein [Nostoc sp. DedQUE09]
MQSRWSDFSPKSIGTVHTFQGGQKSVTIFSTRQCRHHRANLGKSYAKELRLT